MKKKTAVSIHGGLGNQLFQLGLATELSNQSETTLTPWKNRCRTDNVGKIWINYYESSKKYTLNGNTLNQFWGFYARTSFRLRVRSHRSGSAGKFYLLLHKISVFVPRCFQVGIITTEGMGDFEIPRLLRWNYVFAYYQTIRAASSIKEQIKNENLGKLKLQRVNVKSNREILVLHIRRTDYKENPEIGLLPDEYFKDALNHLSQIYRWDELWLFSDDPQEAILMVPDEFKSKLIVMTHSNKTPPETLALMACGTSFILSNSSFGWWAAILAYHPPKYVVVPSKWFSQIDEPVGLIPDGWIRVNL
jgi:hypothetical protein